MLLLSPISPPPLPGVALYLDHLDAQTVYYLPPALALATTAQGERDFFLLRYHGDFSTVAGGLLHMQLALQPLSDQSIAQLQQQGLQALMIGLSRGRFRLRLRSLLESGADQAGDWHPLTLSGTMLQANEVSLAPHETDFLQTLLEQGTNVVEAESDLRYRGLVAGAPWLVTANVAALKTALASSLPAGPANADQVVAAFLSLPATAPLTWQPLDPDKAFERDTLLTELALRSLDILFTREPVSQSFDQPLYSLVPASSSDPERYSWDLSLFRQEERPFSPTWSISELYQQLTTPAEQHRFFPIVEQVSPFAAAEIFVINQLHFDAAFLKTLQVALRYTGPNGVPQERSITFADQQPQIVRFSTVYPALTSDFHLAYRITATLAPPDGSGWPTVLVRDFVESQASVVEISRVTAGIDTVHVEAEPLVFTRASSILVQLFPVTENTTASVSAGGQPSTSSIPSAEPLAQLTLTDLKSEAWIALPGVAPQDTLSVRCLASPPVGVTAAVYLLQDGTLENRVVRIDAYQLEPLTPDRIAISLDPDSAAHFAYVAVALDPVTAPASDEGMLFTLSLNEPQTWSLFRKSVFDPITFRYRIMYVAYDSAGKPLPITTTDWLQASGSSLVVRPPVTNP